MGATGACDLSLLTVLSECLCAVCCGVPSRFQAAVNKESVEAGIKAVKTRKARYAIFKVGKGEDRRSGE
jgi:hypothetical protein